MAYSINKTGGGSMLFLELNDTERDRITGWNGTRLDRIKYGDGWSMKKSDAL